MRDTTSSGMQCLFLKLIHSFFLSKNKQRTWLSQSWSLEIKISSKGAPPTTLEGVCVFSCSVVSDSLWLCPWDSPGKTGMGCHALLQRIFSIQGSDSGLLHYKWILYRLSHQGTPRILEWVAYPFSRGIFLTQELNQCLLHCRWILYQLSYQRSQL